LKEELVMVNKDKIDMFQLLFEILKSAGDEVFIYDYEEETKYGYGYISFYYKPNDEDYSMLFDNGTLKEILRGLV
jgi:hypothetical protein